MTDAAPGHGVSLSRHALDRALLDAARRAGVEVREGVTARVTRLGRDAAEGHAVTLGDGSTVTARVVVVADGLGGTGLTALPPGAGYAVQERPGSRRGVGAVVTGLYIDAAGPGVPGDGEIVMACGRHGYLGAVRLEAGAVDLAAAVDTDAIKAAGGVGQAMAQLVSDAGLTDDLGPLLNAVDRWHVTPGLTRRRRRLAGPGLFIVGDAAGYVEPFTGEGIAWALAGGAAVAPFAAAAVQQWDPAQQDAWHDAHRAAVGRRQRACRVVAWTLRRPRVTRALVHVLAALPIAAAPAVARITRPDPKPYASLVIPPPPSLPSPLAPPSRRAPSPRAPA